MEEGVKLHLTADAQIKRQVDDLVVRGDAIEFAETQHTPRRPVEEVLV